jgi:transcriptional regulator with XRE-family HTH domain
MRGRVVHQIGTLRLKVSVSVTFVPDTLSERIATVVAELVSDLRISQAELSRRTGIHQGTISHFLRGSRTITLDHLEAICHALGVSVTAVVDEAESRP